MTANPSRRPNGGIRRSLLAAAALGLAATVLSAPATAAEQVLRAFAPWPKPFVVTQSLLDYIDQVNAAGKGVVQIQFGGGPEAIPANDQGGALRRGAIDMWYGSLSYLSGILPEARAIASTDRTPPELRANGAYDLIDTILQKKVNAKFIANPDTGWAFYMLLAKPPKLDAKGSLDLSGVRMRSHPMYNDLLVALGSTPVTLPTTDIYTGFERGLLDGLAWPEIGAGDFKLEKFAKYRVYPSYYQSDIVILVNDDKWKSLSPQARKVLLDVGLRHENASRRKFQDKVVAEQKMLDAAGNHAVVLHGEGAAEYLQLADKLLWTEMAKKSDPATVKALREKFVK